MSNLLKKQIILIFALLLPVLSFSQIKSGGKPYFELFTKDDMGNFSQIWCAEQDTNGIMYFGTNYGLKSYDGSEWKSYNLPYSTILFSLKIDKDGILYYGAVNDFGAFIADETGELKCISFYQSKYNDPQPEFGQITSTLTADNKIFFQTHDKIFWCDLPIKIDRNDSLLNEIHTLLPERSRFHIGFSVNDKLYVREWGNGLYSFNKDKLELVPEGEMF